MSLSALPHDYEARKNLNAEKGPNTGPDYYVINWQTGTVTSVTGNIPLRHLTTVGRFSDNYASDITTSSSSKPGHKI